MKKAIKVGVLALLFAFLLASALLMHEFGKPAQTEMDNYFIAMGQKETGSNNIVAAVVFDYRGLDTMGEAAVLFAAATGVFLVFRGRKKDE